MFLLQKLLSCCLQYFSVNKNASKISPVKIKKKKKLTRSYKKLALIDKIEEQFSHDNMIQ